MLLKGCKPSKMAKENAKTQRKIQLFSIKSVIEYMMKHFISYGITTR